MTQPIEPASEKQIEYIKSLVAQRIDDNLPVHGRGPTREPMLNHGDGQFRIFAMHTAAAIRMSGVPASKAQATSRIEGLQSDYALGRYIHNNAKWAESIWTKLVQTIGANGENIPERLWEPTDWREYIANAIK